MTDLIVINTNELGLTDSEQKRIDKMIQDRSVHALAPEREIGPFLLYSVGDDISTIAIKTNLPKDVILATAIQYKWPEKARILKRESLNPIFLQKELANTLLVATYKSLMDELGQVIAGKKDAKQVGLIPKNMTAFQNLMDMITKLNAPAAPNQPAPQTHIHAQNVQVNQQIAAPEEKKDDAKRKEMLKALDD